MMLLQRFSGLAGTCAVIGVTAPVEPPLGDRLLQGLTLQADQCLARGDQHGATMFIELIYDLCDWSENDGGVPDCLADPMQQFAVIGAD